MNDDRDWTSEDTQRLKRELRDEAVRMREQFKREFQEQMAQQLAEMRDRGGPPRGGHQGNPNHGGRGRRGGRQALSRDAIVDAAAEIMAKDGLDKVTMRRIAWALDTGPASIYVHVRSMAELHGLLLDRALAEVDLGSDRGSWDERLASLLDDYATVLMANPELAQSAVSARPAGPHHLALVERILALLDEGGIPPAQAAWGVDILLLHATASAAEHAGREDDDAIQGREWEALRTAMTNRDEYPHIAALGLGLVDGDPQQRSAWAMRVLLAGIAATARD